MIAAYLITLIVVSFSLLISIFPSTNVNDYKPEAAQPPAGENGSTGDQQRQQDKVEYYIGSVSSHKFGVASILGLQLARPSTEAGYFLLAVLAGAIGSCLHALQSLSVFVGNRRFRPSWKLWYFLRVPIGAMLGLLLYAVLRTGLVTGNGDSTSPHGVIAFGGLAGLFSRNALEKLREVFEIIFRTAQRDKDTLENETLTSISPNPVPKPTDPTE